MKQNKILAIIPARSGSKGIPKKNIKKLNGKNMIIYTIEAALQSKYKMRIIVTTDDEETAQISKNHGAETPFIRPEELARDETATLPVLQHTINYLKNKEAYYPETIALLQPTSPLRQAKHIDEAFDLFFKNKVDSIVSLCEAEYPPYWMKRIDNDGRVLPFLKYKQQYTRRQDLPKIYRLNGAIYITKVDIIMKSNKLLGNNTKAYIMKKEDSIDIDTYLDFKLAQLILKEKINNDKTN